MVGQWLDSRRPMVGQCLANVWPMVGQWLDNVWPMAGQWLDNGWPMVGQWLANGWPVVGQWLANGWPSVGQWLANGWPMAGQWLANGLPLVGQWLTNGWPMVGQWLVQEKSQQPKPCGQTATYLSKEIGGGVGDLEPNHSCALAQIAEFIDCLVVQRNSPSIMAHEHDGWLRRPIRLFRCPDTNKLFVMPDMTADDQYCRVPWK